MTILKITLSTISLMVLILGAVTCDDMEETPTQPVTSTPETTPTSIPTSTLAISPTISPSPTLTQVGWYNVYFVPEDDVHAKLIDLVSEAEKSVYAAIHEISVEAITTALIDAKGEGVDVRVVIEKDYSNPNEHPESASQYERLDALDLVRTDDRSALMHNKFLVIDGMIVWTGSTNLTDRGVNHNNNNVIVIESTQLADNFTTEFNEMWDGKFGPTSPSDTSHPEVNLHGSIVECYFAPEDGVEDEIIEELQNAQDSIYFATFAFTSDSIEDKLLHKWNEGLEIKGIYEKRMKSQYCSYEPLHAAGVPVLWDESTYTMHHKFFIIDMETVITGSFNPTKSADESNDENILIVHNSDIASKYYSEFSSMWNEWYVVPDQTTTSIQIEGVNLQAEVVNILNSGSNPVDMTDWRLLSTVGSQEYVFPAFTLEAGAIVQIISGPNAVDNPPGQLLWT
ncbi:MAG: hypothetical protein JSW38_02330, partial [Dehalococcoidia bacterium]